MLGREQEAADAFAAIQAGRPAGFYAACGYGKTRLLQNSAATASERGAAPSCVYLRAAGDRVGICSRIWWPGSMRATCQSSPPRRSARSCSARSAPLSLSMTCAQSPDQVGCLLDVLSGCSLVMGSTHPVLGRRGSSYELGGQPEERAHALVAGDMGWPLTTEELAAARRLVAAVDGQPLHLRQCAALARGQAFPPGTCSEGGVRP